MDKNQHNAFNKLIVSYGMTEVVTYGASVPERKYRKIVSKAYLMGFAILVSFHKSCCDTLSIAHKKCTHKKQLVQKKIFDAPFFKEKLHHENHTSMISTNIKKALASFIFNVLLINNKRTLCSFRMA